MQELLDAALVTEPEIITIPAEKKAPITGVPATGKRFSSITHLHLFAVINTIIYHRFTISRKTTLRILDVGCGNGIMLSTLVKELPLKHPNINFEFYGIDVYDSQVQPRGYFKKTITLLEGTDPGTQWNERLRLLKSTQQWPFPKDFFDLIVSNQVMEHVFNQPFFLSEIKRTMKISGTRSIYTPCSTTFTKATSLFPSYISSHHGRDPTTGSGGPVIWESAPTASTSGKALSIPYTSMPACMPTI